MAAPPALLAPSVPRASLEQGRGSARYRAYVLGLLILVNVCGWVDRNVFSILLESVRLELGLSDTQMGLLGGVAVGVFYAACGLPIAWLADRGNRRSVLAAATALWSLMTALCGMATGFSTLFLARVGIGVGEAGSTPPAHSLISDYFPPRRRAFALGILSLYVPLGFLVGYLAGGWLDELFGWRTAFIVVGAPGLLLALLVRFSLHEPPRGYSERLSDPGETPALHSTLLHFWQRRSMRHLPLGGAIHSIGAFAAAVWLPAYLMRTYDMGSGETGTWMALAYGLGGGVGVVTGGYLADRLAGRSGDERWYVWFPAGVLLLSIPFASLVYVADGMLLLMPALLIATVLGHMFLGPVVAMMQGLAGLRRRAVASACYLFLVNLVASSFGPVSVGLASDYFSASFGADALRYALLAIVTVTSGWAAVHFLLAARTLRQDLAEVRKADAVDAAAS